MVATDEDAGGTLTEDVLGRHALLGEGVLHGRDVGRVDVGLPVDQRLRRFERRKVGAVALALALEEFQRRHLGAPVLPRWMSIRFMGESGLNMDALANARNLVVVEGVDDPVLGVDDVDGARADAPVRRRKDDAARDDVDQVDVEVAAVLRVPALRRHHHLRRRGIVGFVFVPINKTKQIRPPAVFQANIKGSPGWG